MNLKLLAIPLTVSGGIGGTYLGYKYIYQNERKESIKTKLGDLLLGFDSEFSEKWKFRASLVSSKSDLPKSLDKLRASDGNKEISEESIKKWCREQVSQDFSSEKDSLFVSIRSYCTFNNKDKLGSKAISEDLTGDTIKADGKWVTANKKLDGASQEGMSTAMKEMKVKVATSGGTDPKALRAWCESIYPSYFKGNNDPDFRDAQIYCTET